LLQYVQDKLVTKTNRMPFMQIFYSSTCLYVIICIYLCRQIFILFERRMRKEQLNECKEVTLLIDATTLNKAINCVYDTAEKAIGYKPNPLDLVTFLCFAALDSGLPHNDMNAKTKINFIYNESIQELDHCGSSNFEKELNHVGIHFGMGDFTFNSFPTAGMTNCGDMLLNALGAFVIDNQIHNLGVICNYDIIDDVQRIIDDTNKKRNDISITLTSIGPQENGINLFDVLMGSFNFTEEEHQKIENYVSLK